MGMCAKVEHWSVPGSAPAQKFGTLPWPFLCLQQFWKTCPLFPYDLLNQCNYTVLLITLLHWFMDSLLAESILMCAVESAQWSNKPWFLCRELFHHPSKFWVAHSTSFSLATFLLLSFADLVSYILSLNDQTVSVLDSNCTISLCGYHYPYALVWSDVHGTAPQSQLKLRLISSNHIISKSVY